MPDKSNTTAQHTPGPWVWRFPLGGLPELYRERRRLLILDAVRDGFNRATLRFAERSPADAGGLMRRAADFFVAPGVDVPDVQVPMNPDMRLIAAAPEMLFALKSAWLSFTQASGKSPSTSRIDSPECHAAIQAIEAAIAKAEGAA